MEKEKRSLSEVLAIVIIFVITLAIFIPTMNEVRNEHNKKAYINDLSKILASTDNYCLNNTNDFCDEIKGEEEKEYYLLGSSGITSLGNKIEELLDFDLSSIGDLVILKYDGNHLGVSSGYNTSNGYQIYPLYHYLDQKVSSDEVKFTNIKQALMEYYASYLAKTFATLKEDDMSFSLLIGYSGLFTRQDEVNHLDLNKKIYQFNDDKTLTVPLVRTSDNKIIPGGFPINDLGDYDYQTNFINVLYLENELYFSLYYPGEDSKTIPFHTKNANKGIFYPVSMVSSDILVYR